MFSTSKIIIEGEREAKEGETEHSKETEKMRYLRALTNSLYCSTSITPLFMRLCCVVMRDTGSCSIMFPLKHGYQKQSSLTL